MNGSLKMKRSELVKAVCELLETQSHQGTAYMYKSEEIVKLVEKYMLAPINWDKSFQMDQGRMTYNVHEWEKE